MRTYGQYCPIALASEVLAERWTPIIIRNLMVGAGRFGDILDGAPGMPRSVLSQRLRSLEREGVVIRSTAGRSTRYELSTSGHELADVVMALGTWGARWREVKPQHHDPYLALWTIAKLVDPASLPRARVVIRFDLADRAGATSRMWLVASSQGNEVCVTTPGYDEDGIVVTTCEWLLRWHTGRVSLWYAEREAGMQVAGPRWIHRELSRWGSLSPFAGVDLPRPDSSDSGRGRRGASRRTNRTS